MIAIGPAGSMQAPEMVESQKMECFEHIKLSSAQSRVMQWLGNGWTSEPGAGMAIKVNGKRICNVDTMFALKRMGLVEQIMVNGREAVGQWQATVDGKALAHRLGL